MHFLGFAPCWARIPAHGSKKSAIVRIAGFSFQMVPHPTGYSRSAGIARFRCVASLLVHRRGCLGGDRGRRLLAGPDLRRHSVLCVTDTSDFVCEGVSPVRGPFLPLGPSLNLRPSERFARGILKVVTYFGHADVSGVCSYRGGLSDEGIRYRV